MIGDYLIRETIHLGRYATVQRAQRARDGLPVVTKLLREGAPPDGRARLRYEYDILQRLQRAATEGIASPIEWFEEISGHGFAMRDIGGSSLLDHLEKGSLNLPDVLEIGERVARTLNRIHRARVVHKDITPQNIVFNPVTRETLVIDFGISTEIDSEYQALDELESLEGTPAFIPPEQTGRTSGHVDYRTDYYALGATLYYLLSGGAAPFAETEISKLVYQILTQEPRPLDAGERVPAQVSRVVAKLMRKEPEQRYQSAAGIAADLALCRTSLESGARFEPGTHDHPERLELPQRLYGRDREVGVLTHRYDLAAKGARQIVLIGGPSGIGKSALLGELPRSFLRDGARWATGKYDLVRRHVPLVGLRDAVTSLTRMIFREDDEELGRAQRRLEKTLGNLAPVAVEQIPELGRLLPGDSPVPELAGQQAEHRLILAFVRLLRGLASTRPLVLFLDDLQWADGTTLRLIEALAGPEHDALPILFIGAYREDEVTALHPLAATLRLLDDSPSKPTRLSIQPLTPEDAAAFLGDALHLPPAEVDDLARLTHAKTAGNAFFMRAFLRHIWERAALFYDTDRRRWTWDLQAVIGLEVTANVADLLVGRLRAYEPQVQAVLCTAACLGSIFELKTLTQAARMDPPAVAGHLVPALRDGIIVPLARDYKYIASGGTGEIRYRFAHDRILEAAYGLLAEEEVARLHATIGRGLLAAPATTHDAIEIAGHLNRALQVITDPAERRRLAELNVAAGKQAMRSAAWGFARDCFRKASELIQASPGVGGEVGPRTSGAERLAPGEVDKPRSLVRAPARTDPGLAELRLEIELRLAECEFILGDWTQGKQRLKVLLDAEHRPAARARLLHMTMRGMNPTGRMQEIFDLGREALGELGLRLPRRGGLATIAVALLRLEVALRRRPSALERLPGQPEVQDDTRTLFHRISMDTVTATFVVAPQMFAVINLGAMRELVLRGRTAGCECTVGAFLPVVSSLARRRAVDLIPVMEGLIAQCRDRVVSASAKFWLAVWGYQHVRPIPVVSEYLEGVASDAQEIGDHFLWLSCFVALAGLDGHRSLELALRHVTDRLPVAQSQGSVHFCYYAVYVQHWAAMAGKTAQPWAFDGAYLTEARLLETCSGTDGRNVLNSHYSLACLSAYLQRDLPGVIAVGRRLDALDFFTVARGMVLGESTACIYALALIDRLRGGGRPPRAISDAVWCKLRLRRLERHLAANDAEDFTTRGYTLLVAAERADLEGALSEAIAGYAEAVAALTRAQDVLATAIACEAAGRFFLRRQDPESATHHLRRAHELFGAWGSPLKVRALEAEFAELGRALLDPAKASTVHRELARRTTTTGVHNALELDLGTVLRACLAISGEVTDAKVIERIVCTLIENAGADRALLIIPRDRELRVTAEATPNRVDVELGGRPLDDARVPRKLLQFVARTAEAICIEDAAGAHDFQDEPYFGGAAAGGAGAAAGGPGWGAGGPGGTAGAVRSVLSFPVVRKGGLVAILYLESRTLKKAFTPGRMRAIELLAAQAAISLDNAALYANLEARVEERTDALRRANARIVELERRATEARMAGGFAHQINNALTGPRYVMTMLGAEETATTSAIDDLKARIAALERLPVGAELEARLRHETAEIDGRLSKFQKSLTIVAKGVIRAQAMATRTLELTQLEGEPPGETPIEVGRVASQVLPTLRAAAPSVPLELEADPEAKVEISERHFKMILTDLVTNAQEALQVPSAAPAERPVRISAAAANGHVLLEVLDQGPGIPERDRPHLFEAFFSTKPTTGLGLGLARVKRLVDKYGASVEIDRRPEGGTAVKVRFKRA